MARIDDALVVSRKTVKTELAHAPRQPAYEQGLLNLGEEDPRFLVDQRLERGEFPLTQRLDAHGSRNGGVANGQAATWKNSTACLRLAACAAMSRAVVASASAADALRWVTSSTPVSARLICATPDDCSADAVETSWTSCAVRRMAGTSSDSCALERSATSTLVAATPRISCAARWLRSASFRTSDATTAKPLPCSPARAASIAAFNASRFVWKALY